MSCTWVRKPSLNGRAALGVTGVVDVDDVMV
ncbi:hypothetical protein PT2222_20323 [Paraburkholderia tropica]